MRKRNSHKGSRRLSIEQVKLMPEAIQLEIFRQLTNPIANVELPVGNGPLEKKKSPRFASQVCIFVRSLRHRLADPDGISAKAAIDGLVIEGILEDDSAKFVKEVRFTQQKCKTESTTITISDEE